ncbi:HNH endonuclease [Nocardia sp. NPDC059246]|uniref:HNH endonuclease n=1 Tax=unclassified Nocardia TaxID=2637762 RepID=UPI00369A4037
MPKRSRRKVSNGLDHRAYRKARDRLRRQSQVCHLCGTGIDVSLPPTDAMSWTADHIVPRSKGGHLLGEMKAAHRRCNSKRGNKTGAQVHQLRTSRVWIRGVHDSAAAAA